jgi:hypothetical protein
LTHGVSHGLRNSDETPSAQYFQAFCPVLRYNPSIKAVLGIYLWILKKAL